jgi:hypothetical protein
MITMPKTTNHASTLTDYPGLLSVATVAERLKLSKRRVMDFIYEGRLRANYIAGTNVIVVVLEDFTSFEKIVRKPGQQKRMSNIDSDGNTGPDAGPYQSCN